MFQTFAQEGDVCLDTGDVILAKYIVKAPQSRGTIFIPNDHLRDHWVIEDADLIALNNTGLHAEVLGIGKWRTQQLEGAGVGEEVVVRVLGVDTRLDTVAAQRDLLLAHGQRVAGGHLQLPLDQIGAGDHLGDRVLDLQSRVHLHKVELARRRQDEFHSAGAGVVHSACRSHRRLAHASPQLGSETGRRRLLQHLLVASLHAAVALVQVDALVLRAGGTLLGRGRLRGHHLDLHVPRRHHVALEEHARVAKAGGGLALCARQRLAELLAALHQTHALAAARHHALDQQRVADAIRLGRQEVGLLPLAVIAGHHRHAGRLHQRLAGALVAHGADRLRRRTHEAQTRRLHRLRKAGVLTQEAVARMHRLGSAASCRLQHRLRPQVAAITRRRAHTHRLVGLPHVLCIAIRLAVDCHRAHTQPLCRPHHSTCDLAAVRHQQLVKERHSSTARVTGIRLTQRASLPQRLSAAPVRQSSTAQHVGHTKCTLQVDGHAQFGSQLFWWFSSSVREE
mmetsp:Transcript_23926/g.59862  ORF Transcript_23926/g.59862 Transcript_23926/m.59862 type:complete len:509 (-) Transcript_23926:23-1549(-)